MTTSRWVRASTAALLSGWLFACGGGGSGDDPAFRAVDLEATTAAAPGALAAGDPVAPDDSLFDLYRVRLSQSGRLTVRLESADFDAYLVLCDGRVLDEPNLLRWEPYCLAEDDDSGGGTDAQIAVDLPAGTYVVVVNAWETGVGSYVLRASFAPDGAAPPQLGTVYLQYRSYEDGVGDRFQGWVQLTRDGAPVEETEVFAVSLFDPSGGFLTPTGSGFHPGQYWFLNCDVDPCAEVGPMVDHGFWASFAALDAGTYDLEVDTVSGATLTRPVVYPGRLELPVVPGASMEARWAGGDLALTWENPADEAHWPDVTRIHAVLFDGSGHDVLYVRVPPTASGVTVPADLLDRAAALGDGTLTRWEVQTRAYDASGMNYARGYSARVALP